MPMAVVRPLFLHYLQWVTPAAGPALTCWNAISS